jgi:hypothetical protein
MLMGVHLSGSIVLLALMLIGCGAKVVDERPPGGGGGTAASGGSGGETCGGFAGAACSRDQFCAFEDGSCGSADATGVCEPRPQGCTEDCPGVCGCDGNFYCNACMAHNAGVEVSAMASCRR